MQSSSISPFEDIGNDRMQIAVRAWIIWLQVLFGSRPLGQYKWDRNEAETEIYIAGTEPIDYKAIGVRPRVIVTRSGASWIGTSASQMMQPGAFGLEPIFSDLMNISFVLTVTAKEGLEAQNLAYWIYKLIPLFKAEIMRKGRMHAIMQNINIGTETPYGAIVSGSPDAEWKSIQITIPASIQETISIKRGSWYTKLKDAYANVE